MLVWLEQKSRTDKILKMQNVKILEKLKSGPFDLWRRVVRNLKLFRNPTCYSKLEIGDCILCIRKFKLIKLQSRQSIVAKDTLKGGDVAKCRV